MRSPAGSNGSAAAMLVLARTSMAGTESAFLKSADITGSVGGAAYTDRLWIHAYPAAWPHGGQRWFVILGPSRNGHPKGTAN